jgi:hypothetical protein
MKFNYCELKRNKIYVEIFDELLDDELNMNNPLHNDKIIHWMEKKIKSVDYIKISNTFNNQQDLMEDLILLISADANNQNIQGNTLMMYADDNSMYELFYMEDLTKKIPEDELNEFGSITNIFLQPVCWTCGIIKSSYGDDGNIYGDIITKSDVVKLFIQNYYHKGVMLNQDGTIIEIEFTGENPFNTIGNNFSQSNTLDLFGFNLIPWIEKSTTSQLNTNASKIMGKEIYSRVFFSIVCPNTNKKFWDITPTTINNILQIIDNKEIQDKIYKEIEQAEININPFYFIKKCKK